MTLILRVVRLVLTCMLLLAFPLSLRADGSTTAKGIPFFGRVVAVHLSDGTATIEHGKVPGFAEAATTDYRISPESMLAKLHQGDDIRAVARSGEITLDHVVVVSHAKAVPRASGTAGGR